MRDELSSDWLKYSAQSAHSQAAKVETADPAIQAQSACSPVSFTFLLPKSVCEVFQWLQILIISIITDVIFN